MNVQPFTVQVPDAELTDLRTRLAHTRWPEYREWGHVPMWSDPEGVADLILEGTR